MPTPRRLGEPVYSSTSHPPSALGTSRTANLSRILARYTLAVLAVVLAALLRWALDRQLRDTSQFATFYLALLATALTAGAGPTLLVTVLGALTGIWLFVQPRWVLALGDAPSTVRLLLYITIGLSSSVLAGRMRALRHRAARQAHEAAARAEELAELVHRLDADIEQRKRVQEELASVAQFPAENPSPVMRIGPEGHLLYANEAAQTLLQQESWQRGSPVPPSLREPVNQALADHAQHDIEFVGRDRRVIAFLCVPVTDKGYANLYGRDVSEARRAQEALSRSERRLRTFFESGMVGTIYWNMDGQIIDANDKFLQMVGYSRQDLTGGRVRWAEMTPQEYRPLDEHALAELKADGVDTPYEKEFLRKDGARVPIIIGAAMLDDTRHEGVAFVLDITERKQREKAQATLAAVVESSADAIVSESLDGTILSWNAGAERLFGYTASEAVGRSIAMLLPESQIPVGPEDLRVSQAGESIRRREVERVRKDGLRITVSLSISPVLDASGRTIGLAKIAHDITDIKRAQAALNAAMRSAERAKAAAEEANQAKDHFLAMLSHELRTPLTPVLTTAGLLESDRGLPDRFREDAQMIRRNVELEARLIDDLLDVTRIARGKMELDKRPVELCEIIRRAVEVCRPDMEARGLHFGADLGREAPYVIHADPARLQQVFWNLLKNAIKFTPHGGCVGVRCRTDGDGFVSAEVGDSGAGIDHALLPRIFNAFEQGGTGVTRQFGGLGLGLTITKRLVERHGGSIVAHSEGKGKGAMFRVRLPLVSAGAAVRVAVPPEAPAAADAQKPAARLRILLVEDHGDTAKIMRRLLRIEGHDVDVAGDVATALELAAARPFDLLISDLGLPDGNGVDLLAALRQQGLRMPAIALSGYGQEQDVQRTRDAGFAVHLTKPVNTARLSSTIAKVTAPVNAPRQ